MGRDEWKSFSNRKAIENHSWKNVFKTFCKIKNSDKFKFLFILFYFFTRSAEIKKNREKKKFSSSFCLLNYFFFFLYSKYNSLLLNLIFFLNLSAIPVLNFVVLQKILILIFWKFKNYSVSIGILLKLWTLFSTSVSPIRCTQINKQKIN